MTRIRDIAHRGDIPHDMKQCLCSDKDSDKALTDALDSVFFSNISIETFEGHHFLGDIITDLQEVTRWKLELVGLGPLHAREC